MNFNQNILKYFFIYLLFVPLAIFSTFYGSFVVDEYMGYHDILKYNNIGRRCDAAAFSSPENQKYELEQKYSSEIKSGINFPEKEKYLHLKSQARKESIMVGASFIILLLGSASLGCVLVFSRLGVMFSRWQPFFIMLASIWAFEPLRLLFYIYFNNRIPRPENWISEGLNLPSYFLIILLSIIGLIISFFF